MNESNAIRIANVKYKGDYTLRLRWANDKVLTVDLREPVFRLKGMRPLRDTAAFALAGVGEGGHSVVWPGEIDMGAARLLEMALEQNGRADAVEFIRWRWKHGLSLTDAGKQRPCGFDSHRPLQVSIHGVPERSRMAWRSL